MGAGLGLCGILAHRLGAIQVVMTDGDVDTLNNLRENVQRNLYSGENKVAFSVVTCPQLIWGHDLDIFQRQHMNNMPIDVIIAADIIYVEEILEPLWRTVDNLLDVEHGIFLLAYARRNVPIDLVLEYARRYGFEWTCPDSAEGVFIFTRQDSSNALSTTDVSNNNA